MVNDEKTIIYKKFFKNISSLKSLMKISLYFGHFQNNVYENLKKKNYTFCI